MNASNFLRCVLYLLLLLRVVPASAQMRDQENASPRVLASLAAPAETGVLAEAAPTVAVSLSAAQGEQLLHRLADALQLQPNQVLAVRRVLAGSPACAPEAREAAVAPEQELRGLLTETQLARLQQWEAALPCAERATLVATLR